MKRILTLALVALIGASGLHGAGREVPLSSDTASTTGQRSQVGAMVIYGKDGSDLRQIKVDGTGALQTSVGAGGAANAVTVIANTTDFATETTLNAVKTAVEGVISVDDNAGSLTVDGTVAATQSGAWTVTTTEPGAARAVSIIANTTDFATETTLGTIDADTSALAGTVAGTELQVDIVAPLPAGTNTIGGITLEDTAAAFKTVNGGKTSVNTNETHCWNCDDSFTASGTIPGLAVTTERITTTGTTAINTGTDHVALVGVFVQQDTDGGGASLCEIEVDGTPVFSFRFDRSGYYPIGEKFLNLDAVTAIDVVITQGGGGTFDGAVTVSYYAE